MTYIYIFTKWIIATEWNKNLPNHDACSFVSAIGSDLLVRLWNVMAGNPKPIPDDKIEKFAKRLINNCLKQEHENYMNNEWEWTI